MLSTSTLLTAALSVAGSMALTINTPYGPQLVVPSKMTNVTVGTHGLQKRASLVETYNAGNWLDKFDVMAISDPTHGFVRYVSKSEAQSKGYYKVSNNQVYIGVDSNNVISASSQGRDSVRIESKNSYTRGLFIADFAHIPGSNCGSWPAYWMYGPNWPGSGEIDIIEGVHLNTYNQATLHSSPGCNVNVGSGGQTGQVTGSRECGAGGGYNGCGVMSTQATSYGTAFNANGGGVYAMLWRSNAIKVWYFPRNAVPGDINSNNPNPDGWGVPQANFGGCNFDTYFKNNKIVFDITFCGDWAGSVWGQTSCASINPSCNAYVASQPQSFRDSYWSINSLKVYSV